MKSGMPKWRKGELQLLLEVASQQAVAGSRNSEAEVELRVADVDGRRGTEDTVVAGSGFTRKATGVSRSAGTEGDLPAVEERYCWKIKSDGTR